MSHVCSMKKNPAQSVEAPSRKVASAATFKYEYADELTMQEIDDMITLVAEMIIWHKKGTNSENHPMEKAPK
jgi:hypothetical protein